MVNELRLAEITTLAAANVYLRDRFVPDYNATFSCAPADPASAFVGVGPVDLEQIFCHQEERIVARDNTVAFEARTFQLAPQPGRRSCAGLKVLVRRHLTGAYSIWSATRRLGLYPQRPSGRATGRPRYSLWTLPGPWTPKARPPPLGKRRERVSHSVHRPPRRFEKRSDHLLNEADRSLVNNRPDG